MYGKIQEIKSSENPMKIMRIKRSLKLVSMTIILCSISLEPASEMYFSYLITYQHHVVLFEATFA
jgi:hypothetical protein